MNNHSVYIWCFREIIPVLYKSPDDLEESTLNLTVQILQHTLKLYSNMYLIGRGSPELSQLLQEFATSIIESGTILHQAKCQPKNLHVNKGEMQK